MNNLDKMKLELYKMLMLNFKKDINKICDDGIKFIDDIKSMDAEESAKHFNDIESMLNSLGIQSNNKPNNQ